MAKDKQKASLPYRIFVRGQEVGEVSFPRLPSLGDVAVALRGASYLGGKEVQAFTFGPLRCLNVVPGVTPRQGSIHNSSM